MSEHKIGLSNWTTEAKKLYQERRNKGLRGQTGAVTVHQAVKSEDGSEQHIPLAEKMGSLLSRGKQSDRRTYKREQGRAVVRQQRKGAIRGE